MGFKRAFDSVQGFRWSDASRLVINICNAHSTVNLNPAFSPSILLINNPSIY